MAKKREKASCGCRMQAAVYPKKPWNDWGRVDVQPTCKKPNHFEELERLSALMKK